MQNEEVKNLSDSITTIQVPEDYYEYPRQKTPEQLKDMFVEFYNTTHFDLIENFGGVTVIEGATYNRKGIATSEALTYLDVIKETLKQFAKHPIIFILNKEKAIRSFNAIFDRAFKRFKVKRKWLCASAYSNYVIVNHFLCLIGIDKELAEQTAYNLAQLFEYDDAYRYRVQDIVGEVSLKLLIEDPIKEINRLLVIYEQRENNKNVAKKIIPIVKKLSYLLYIPKYKRAFVSTLDSINLMRFDTADWYWVCMREDYNFGGIPFADRIKTITRPKIYSITITPINENKVHNS